VTDQLQQPEALMQFVKMADRCGLCARLVEFLESMPVLGLLSTADAYSLLCALFSTKADYSHWGHGLGDCMHFHVLFEKLTLEGLTGQQCASLLELAVRNQHYLNAAVLCTLPATQLVDAAALEQLLCSLLQPVEAPVSCDGHCHGVRVRCTLMASLLALPAITEFSPATIHGIMEAAVQAAHLPYVDLLAERLYVAGQQLRLSQEQLVAMLRYGVSYGDVGGITLLTATPAARHLSAEHLQEILCAAMAPAHRCRPLPAVLPNQTWQQYKEQYWASWMDDFDAKQKQRAHNMTAVRSLLLRLPAVAALPTSVMAVMLQRSIAEGYADTAVELLTSPLVRFDSEVLLEQCLSCTDDDASQYDKWWQGQMSVLEALLRHPAAQQFGVAALQRLVSAFGHPGLGQFGTGFHPLELVMRLPVAKGLDAAALLTLVTKCIETYVPVHGYAAALTTPAAAQWSSAQVRGLVQAAARVRNAPAVDQLLRHPAAPAATDLDVQLCRALFIKEDYASWLPLQAEKDRRRYSRVWLKGFEDEENQLDGVAGNVWPEQADGEEEEEGMGWEELLDDNEPADEEDWLDGPAGGMGEADEEEEEHLQGSESEGLLGDDEEEGARSEGSESEGLLGDDEEEEARSEGSESEGLLGDDEEEGGVRFRTSDALLGEEKEDGARSEESGSQELLDDAGEEEEARSEGLGSDGLLVEGDQS
jgi:hypothetical protein